VQTPSEQVSVVAGHVVHAPPFTPHCVGLPVTHVEPVQQPPAHVSARHAGHVPPLHAPGRQLSQAAPPEPHRASALPGSQVEPLQHPEHDVSSQRHTPPEQCCPVPQGLPVPHRQEPLAEHVSAVMPHASHLEPLSPQSFAFGGVTQVVPEQQPLVHELELQMQEPPLHTCPAPHAAPVPHRQVPFVQLSADVELQSTHADPSAPQVCRVDV
jgi:hypothetical protein